MQLIALEDGKSVIALYAQKGKDYTCPGCQGTVRLRGGKQYQLHFFHPNPKTNCTNHSKSPYHLQTQLRLKKIFPDAHMEHYFPEVNRFADVVVPSKKLIFEVQCSPISLFEVRARQKAYARTGYLLVWILHEKNFNKRRLSDSERHLRKFPSYYTNIDPRGKGWIYDQLELISDVKRFYIGKKCPIHLTQHYYFKKDMFQKSPKSLTDRIENWPVFFSGDLLFRIWRDPDFSDLLTHLEKKGKRQKTKKIWITLFKNIVALHDKHLKAALLRNAKRS